MYTKNALGNLKNRYKAVLKKCHLLNTFGSLAMVGALTFGAVSLAGNASAFTPTLDSPTIKEQIKDAISKVTPVPTPPTGSTSWDSYIDSLTINSAYIVTNITDNPSTASNYFTSFTTQEEQADGTYLAKTYGISLKARDYDGTSNTNTYNNITDFVLNTVTSQKSNPLVTDTSLQYGSLTTADVTLTANPTDKSTYSFSIETVDDAGGKVTKYYKINVLDASGTAITNPVGTRYDGSKPQNDIISNFINHSSSSGGGAIYNSSSRTISAITGDFINNSAEGQFAEGGAIYNNLGATITSITGDFINNSLEGEFADGGAIYNDGTITSIAGDFINNSSASYGGAIYNNNRATITSISGDFINNSATTSFSDVYGGAIYNDGTITSLIGDFINNSATSSSSTAFGGAIHNYGSATITSISGDFINNSATSSSTFAYGGAINNEGPITSIIGDFINNSASYGGAINNRFTITSIIGDFINNSATDSGGAINNEGSITSITGDFINNSTTSSRPLFAALGGAIRNSEGATITSISGDFINNSVTSSFDAYGGAINNDGIITSITGDFINNSATSSSSIAYGGAIRNVDGATITSISGDFINNSVTSSSSAYGGAIYSFEDLTFKANGASYIISGNYTSNDGGNTKDYNAIYFKRNANLNFNLSNGASYTLDDNVKTDGSDTYTVNITGNGVGENVFNLNNELQNTSSVNLTKATLNFGTVTHDSKIFNGDIGSASLKIDADSTVNVNGTTTFNGAITNSGTLNINADVNAQNSTFTTQAGSSVNVLANSELQLKDDAFGGIDSKGLIIDSASITLATNTINNSGKVTVYETALGSTVDKGYYEQALKSVGTYLTGNGTINFDGVTNAGNYSLDTIPDTSGSELEVWAGTLDGNKTVSISHLVARGDDGSTASTISQGSSLTITGANSDILSQGDIANNGTLNLGTTGEKELTIQGMLTNNGKLTGNSFIVIQGALSLQSGAASFNDLTVTGLSTLESGTTTTLVGSNVHFNGGVTGNGSIAITENGATTFYGNEDFAGDITNSGRLALHGSASLSGEITNNNTITIHGTNSISNIDGSGGFSVSQMGRATLNGVANLDGTVDNRGTLSIASTGTANLNGTYAGTGTITALSGSTLAINNNIDLSSASLNIESGTNFTLGSGYDLTAKIGYFASVDASNNTVSSILTNGVKQQLTSDGNLILTGLSGNMLYSEYAQLLDANGDKDVSDGIINGGTLDIANVFIDASNSKLDDILNGSSVDSTVQAGNIAPGTTITVGGITGTGVTTNEGNLTVTGKDGVISEGNLENKGGTLNTGTGTVGGGGGGQITNNGGTLNMAGTNVGSVYSDGGELNLNADSAGNSSNIDKLRATDTDINFNSVTVNVMNVKASTRDVVVKLSENLSASDVVLSGSSTATPAKIDFYVPNGVTFTTEDLFLDASTTLYIGENITGTTGGAIEVTGNITLDKGTIFKDPAWQNGVGIEGASSGAFAKFSNGIDGNLIAGQNSFMVLGDVNATWAKDAFASSGLTWGQNAISSALFIKQAQTLNSASGAIVVDGSLTSPTSPSANSATFANNSLLFVDASGLGASPALKATDGTLSVAGNSQLLIADGKAKQEIIIVDGFTDNNGVSKSAWGINDIEQNLHLTSQGLVVDTAVFDETLGKYVVTLKAAFLPEDYPMMQYSTGQFIKAMGDGVGFDTDSQNTGVKFISRAIDDRYMDVENKNLLTSTVEGALQMASVGAVAGTALDVTKAGNRAIGQQNNLSASMSEDGQNGMSGGNSGSTFTQGNISAWLTPIYGHTNTSGFDSGSFDSGYQSNFGGTAIGADYTINNSLRFGFGVNVGTGSSESKGDFNKTENDFNYLGGALYASYFMDNFAVSADISYTALDGELEQKLPASMGMSNLKSDADSDVFSLGVMAEYRFNLEHFDLTPYVGLRYSHVATDGYSIHSADATGNGQIAKVASDSQDIFSIPVGVTVSKEIETASGWEIAPKMELGVVANFGDLEATSKARIADVPAVSTLKMDNVDGFAFMGGLGIEVKKDNLSLNLNYHLEASEHKQNHGVFANIEYKF